MEYKEMGASNVDTCIVCGETMHIHVYSCSYCSYIENWVVCTGPGCGHSYGHDNSHTCPGCNGTGETNETNGFCATHSMNGDHYYCDTHGFAGTGSTCTYCSHEKSGPHAI